MNKVELKKSVVIELSEDVWKKLSEKALRENKSLDHFLVEFLIKEAKKM